MKSFEKYRVSKMYDISDENQIMDIDSTLVGIKIFGVIGESWYPIYYIEWNEKTPERILVTCIRRSNKDYDKYYTYYAHDGLAQNLEDCAQRILKKLFHGYYADSFYSMPPTFNTYLSWSLFSDWKIRRIPYGYTQYLLKETKKAGEYMHPAITAGLPKMLPHVNEVQISDKQFIKRQQIHTYRSVDCSKSKYFLITKP